MQAADTMLSVGILSGKIAQSGAEEIYKKIRAGRREVDLFQHHDAITGTEKDFVHRDYADHLLAGYKNLKEAFSQTLSSIAEENVVAVSLEENLTERGKLPVAKTIEIGASCVFLDVYNSLLHKTEDLVRVKINSAKISASYLDGTKPVAQLNPFWDVVKNDQFEGRVSDSSSFELLLVVAVDGLATKRVKLCPSSSPEVPLAKISLGGSADGQNIESNFATSRISGDPELVSPKLKAVLNGRNGLLKEVKIDGRVHKVELQFAKYGCRGRGNSQDNSGSYLFAPDKLSVPVFGQQSSGNCSINSNLAKINYQKQ
jgi:alpha-mannosidase II